jgi:hypothetical protein
MTNDDTGAAGGLSPRVREFYAARNAVIAEYRQREADLKVELTARLTAMRAEFEAAPLEREDAEALGRAQDRATRAEADWNALDEYYHDTES